MNNCSPHCIISSNYLISTKVPTNRVSISGDWPRNFQMAQRIFRHGVIILLLIVAGCVKKAPTSPSFEYAGEWRGNWHDYTIWYANTGNPVGGTLVLNVDKDGSASASGNFKRTIEGGGKRATRTTYTERLYIRSFKHQASKRNPGSNLLKCYIRTGNH